MRRSATASASASGIEAADVLPCRSTVVTILAGRNAELMRRTVDDPLVGLMRNEPIDVGDGVARRLEGVLDHVGDHRHGMAKHLAAFHAQVADGAGR